MKDRNQVFNVFVLFSLLIVCVITVLNVRAEMDSYSATIRVPSSNIREMLSRGFFAHERGVHIESPVSGSSVRGDNVEIRGYVWYDDLVKWKTAYRYSSEYNFREIELRGNIDHTKNIDGMLGYLDTVSSDIDDGLIRFCVFVQLKSGTARECVDYMIDNNEDVVPPNVRESMEEGPGVIAEDSPSGGEELPEDVSDIVDTEDVDIEVGGESLRTEDLLEEDDD